MMALQVNDNSIIYGIKWSFDKRQHAVHCFEIRQNRTCPLGRKKRVKCGILHHCWEELMCVFQHDLSALVLRGYFLRNLEAFSDSDEARRSSLTRVLAFKSGRFICNSRVVGSSWKGNPALTYDTFWLCDKMCDTSCHSLFEDNRDNCSINTRMGGDLNYWWWYLFHFDLTRCLLFWWGALVL